MTDIVTHFITLSIGFLLGMVLMCLFTISDDEEDEHAKNIGIESYRGKDNDL